MRLGQFLTLLGLTLSAAALQAQTAPAGSAASEQRQAPRVEVTLGYAYLHANAPPGSCAAFHLVRGFSLVGDVSGSHANGIAGTSQDITVVNYLFGPRFSLRSERARAVPYGQVLLGGSTELSTSAAADKVSAFAFSAGGGLNVRLTRRFGLNLMDAGWFHSQLPNATNNRQNDLSIGSGVMIRF